MKHSDRRFLYFVLVGEALLEISEILVLLHVEVVVPVTLVFVQGSVLHRSRAMLFAMISESAPRVGTR